MRAYAPRRATVVVTKASKSGRQSGYAEVADLEAFGEQVKRDLLAAASEAYPPLPRQPDPLLLERALHDAAAEARAETCFGRDGLLAQLQEYCLGGGGGASSVSRPLVLWGEPGAGKSVVMACALRRLRAALSGAGDLVLAHVVGATAASLSLRSMLARLCAELRQRFQVPGARGLEIGENPPKKGLKGWLGTMGRRPFFFQCRNH